MTANHYAPPKEKLVTEEPSWRNSEAAPKQLLIALWLLGAVLFGGALNLMILLGRPTSRWGLAVTLAAIRAGVGVLWVYGLYRRKNWLRWLTVTWAFLSVVAQPFLFPRVATPAERIITLSEVAVMSCVAILLVTGEGRRWFYKAASAGFARPRAAQLGR
jgi:hypothetical protein